MQVATQVSAAEVYDEFSSTELDTARWVSTAVDHAADPAAARGYEVETGDGQLQISALDGDAGFLSTQRFGLPPGSLVGFELEMTFAAQDVAAPTTVGPPMGEISVRDLPSGMLLGFEVTNEAIFAVHRRTGVPGVAAESEHFSHRVITETDTKPGQSHRYRISYQHNTSQARWYVDEHCVYAALVPLQIEGVSLSMGIVHGGNDAGSATKSAAATWTAWQIGTG